MTSASHLDESSDNAAHHMAKKAVAPHIVRDERSFCGDSRRKHHTFRGVRFRTGSLERGKIVTSLEPRCCRRHRLHVENRSRDVPGIGALKWTQHRFVPDS